MSDLVSPEHQVVMADALVSAIDAHQESCQENWDSLGVSASIAGKECLRSLWYSLRWVAEPQRFEAKTLRIFETGNWYEDRMVMCLSQTCDRVWDQDSDGKQFKAELVHGWVRGKVDAIVQGVPGLPADEVLAVEMKSHNDRNFKKVVKLGVRLAKIEHYVQLQLYLRHFGFSRGLYMAMNKNTDDLHIEVVMRDDAFLSVLLGNLENTIKSNFAPPRLSDDPDFFGCRFCDHRKLCHGQQTPQRRTCRTCVHASPAFGPTYPTFDCERHQMPVSSDDQKKGCANHLFLPELIPAEQIDVCEESETITFQFENGEVWIDNSNNLPPTLEAH